MGNGLKKGSLVLTLSAGFVIASALFGGIEADAATHKVKSGDTLWKLSNTYNVSVKDIKEWNGLSKDTIYVGQQLTINLPDENKEQTAKTQATSNLEEAGYDIDKLIETVNDLVGTPYKWGGTNPDGFDCSGFIYYVYNQAGLKINRQPADGYFDNASYVKAPQLGDLVFFKDTYKSGVSHVGVYIGNNEFIHADSKKVMVSSLTEKYWKNHFHSYKRFNK